MLRRKLGEYLQRKINVKPEGTLFIRLLIRFYDKIYFSKEYKKFLENYSK